MELREFLAPLRKYGALIIFLFFLSGGIIYLLSQKIPLQYQASVTVYVQRLPEKKSGDYYTYEGFYAQKAAQEYTDTVLGFLKSPDIIRRAAIIVWEKVDEKEEKKLQRAVQATKTAPQLIHLSVTWKDEESARNLVSALAQAVKERAQVLNQAGDEAMQIDLLTNDPLVQTKRPHKILNSIVGGGIVVLLATMALWSYEYLKGTLKEA